MKRFTTILIAALATTSACKSKADDAKSGKPAAAVKESAPVAKTDAPAAKGDDLAQMVELAKRADLAAFPQADAVLGLDRDDITLAADGTVTHHHKSIVKLLDAQRGKEKFADVHVPFDTKRQTLTIDTARTVNADGQAHVAAPEEIGDIVPPRLADATMYSDVRERVVSFPAVDKGSVVELEYTRTTKPSPDSALGGEELLAQWDPSDKRIVTITAPAGMTPKFSVIGDDVKPVESQAAGGNHTWTFEIDKEPDRHPETGSLVQEAVLPRLVYSFAPSWAKVLEPIAGRFLEVAVPAAIPASVKAQADQLVAGAKTDSDKAQALFKFVAHDIRSVDLPLGWAGYEPHAPDVVLANRYADARDKVCLLLALAAAEGLHGKPVLVRTGKVQVIDSVPTAAQFDRMIATLNVDGKDQWVDPDDADGQFGLAFAGQDNLVLPIEKGGSELGQRPALDPSSSISHVTAAFALSANGDLDAKYNYELSGWYADRASGEFRALKGEPLDQFFQQSAGHLSPSAVDKGHQVGDTMSVTGPIQLAQHVSVPGYSAMQANFRVVELPPVTLGVAEELPSAGLNTRKYPLWIGTPRTEKGDMTLSVPAGWKIAYVPPKLEGSADGITYSSTCEVNGQTVTCHDQVVLDKLELAVDKYAPFREALTKLQSYDRRVVLLTKA